MKDDVGGTHAIRQAPAEFWKDALVQTQLASALRMFSWLYMRERPIDLLAGTSGSGSSLGRAVKNALRDPAN